MADNLNVTPGAGKIIGADEVVDATLGTVTVGFGKIMDGTLDSTNKLTVNASGEALVKPTANSQVDMNKVAGTTVDVNSGTKSAGTQRVVLATDQPQLTNALKVDGSAVTQPVSVAAVVHVDDNSSTLSVDDGGGSLTVDGTVAVSGTVTVDSELTTADLDTGAGTDTRAVVGLVGSKSGGGVLIPGDATKGLAVDLTATGQNTTALKVDGSAVTQPVSGTVTTTPPANASTNVAQLAGTTTDTNSGSKSAGTLRVVLATDQPALTNKLLVTPDSVALPANQSVNVSQINAVTPLMGNGVTGTGSQRVTVASDNTPFPVKTDQTTHGTTDLVAADITKVAGSAISQGHGTAAAAIRVELPTDGTGVVGLATGSNTIGALTANQSVNVAQVGGSNVSTAATGVQKVGVVGNAGATVDSTIGPATAPTNAVAVSSVYNSSAPGPTNGQAQALQADQAGNLKTFPGSALKSLSTWDSGTGGNSTQTIMSNSGAAAALVELVQTTPISGGAVTFEVTYDSGGNWVSPSANLILDPTSASYAQLSNPYTLQASTNKQFLVINNGWNSLRVKLSTVITGAGTVTPTYNLLATSPVQASPLLSGTKGSSASAAVTSTASGSNHQPVDVAIYDASGNQITSFGGGTQYAEATTTSPATGTAMLGRYKATPPSLTDGQMNMPMLDSSGSLKVTGSLSVGGTTDEASFTAASSTFTGVGGVYNDTVQSLTPGQQGAVRLTADRRLKVDTGSVTAGGVTQINNQQIGGADTAITADGTQLVSLAGPLGDPIDTTGNALNVSVSGVTSANPLPVVSYPSLDPSVSGVLGSLNSAVTLGPFGGKQGLTIGFKATAVSGTFVLELSNDPSFSSAVLGTFYIGSNGASIGNVTVTSGSGANSTFWFANTSGFAYARVRCSAYTSGSTGATITANPNAPSVISTNQAPGDSQGNFANAVPQVFALAGLYNGSNYDRARSAGGAAAAGTGVLAASLSPTTAQLGLTKFRNTALSNTAVAVKASSGRMHKLHAFSSNTVDSFLQFYDVAQGSVTVGTTTPDWTYWVPAGGAVDLSEVMSLNFGTAITVAATTTIAGGTGPTTGLLVNIGYI